MSLDFGDLHPGDRLPWHGKVWTVEKWTKKHHPPHWDKHRKCMCGVMVEPILVLRSADGGRLRIGPFSPKWPAFCRDMEGVWLRSQPAPLPAWAHKLGALLADALPRHANDNRGYSITAMPWHEDR